MLEGGRGTAVIWGAAAVLATLALVRLLGGDERGSGAPLRIDGGRIDGGAAASGPATRAGTPGAAGSREEVFVHVAGAVRRPGLYRLERSARVAEAVQRAGGPLRRAELTAVNLAARVADGQQVIVPVVGGAGGAAVAPGTALGAGGAAAGAAAAGAGGASGAAGPKISLGAATAEQLEELDGIGPTLAGRIIEYRDAQGGLRSLEQLAEVDGIGEKRLAALRDGLQP
jgi:competence protein ComEA